MNFRISMQVAKGKTIFFKNFVYLFSSMKKLIKNQIIHLVIVVASTPCPRSDDTFINLERRGSVRCLNIKNSMYFVLICFLWPILPDDSTKVGT